ncbi:MAG TPA: hypothetical protein PK022_10365 [Syntrophales bacterium]|jgi:hypothetical protein|nr:hypothetical protein [Syntrophales bacterium]
MKEKPEKLLTGIGKSILHTPTIKATVPLTDMVGAPVADGVKGALVMDSKIMRRTT